MKKQMVYYVRVSYVDFKFYDAEEAITFAESAILHCTDFKDDDYVRIEVHYESIPSEDEVEDIITEITDIDD